jgi:ribosomal protein S18 acetylase RimI-like enzyme
MPLILKHRFAAPDDVPLLARMNRRLIEDENHRNRDQSDAWLTERMRGFLAGDYRAVLFESGGEPAGYALYTERTEHADEIRLRQIYVERGKRRRGIGREMLRILRDEIWPAGRRITVGVLAGNADAIAFYRAIGFKPYAVEMEMPARGGKENPHGESIP